MSDKNRPGLLDGAKREDDIDLQRMLDTAVAFFLAGERCRSDVKLPNYPNHEISAPTVVCYSFSVEIAIKLILNLHDIQYNIRGENGHCLRSLFDKIPQDSKSHLIFLEDAIIELEKNYDKIIKLGIQENAISESDARPDLRREKQKVVSPFIEWRYPFEQKFLSASPDQLRRMFIVSHREIRRLLPSLRSVYETDWGSFEPRWFD